MMDDRSIDAKILNAPLSKVTQIFQHPKVTQRIGKHSQLMLATQQKQSLDT